jgi:hypothetical protein
LMAYTGKSSSAGAYTPVDPANISAELNSVTVRPRQPAVQSTQNEPAHDPPQQSVPPQSSAYQNEQAPSLPSVMDLQAQDGR